MPVNAALGGILSVNNTTRGSDVVVSSGDSITGPGSITVTGGVTVDALDSSGALNIGTSTATAITIGRSGITTDFPSGSTVDFSGVTVNGLSNSFLNVGSATDAVATGDLAAGTTASGGLFYDASDTTLSVGLGTATKRGVSIIPNNTTGFKGTTAIIEGEHAVGASGDTGGSITVCSGRGDGTADNGWVWIWANEAGLTSTTAEDVFIEGGYSGNNALLAQPGVVNVYGGSYKGGGAASAHGAGVELWASLPAADSGTPALNGGDIGISCSDGINGGTNGAIKFFHDRVFPKTFLTGTLLGQISSDGWQVDNWLNVGAGGLATATADLAAGSSAENSLHWDDSNGRLNLYSSTAGDTNKNMINLIIRNSTGVGAAGLGGAINWTIEAGDSFVDQFGSVSVIRQDSLATSVGYGNMYFTTQRGDAGPPLNQNNNVNMLILGNTDVADGGPRAEFYDHDSVRTCMIDMQNQTLTIGSTTGVYLDGDTGFGRIGTAADATAAGDWVSGLTGAARVFYDQSDQSMCLFDSSGDDRIELKADLGLVAGRNAAGTVIWEARQSTGQLTMRNAAAATQILLDSLTGYGRIGASSLATAAGDFSAGSSDPTSMFWDSSAGTLSLQRSASGITFGTNLALMAHNSSGAGGAGMGAGINWQLETTSGTLDSVGTVGTILRDNGGSSSAYADMFFTIQRGPTNNNVTAFRIGNSDTAAGNVRAEFKNSSNATTGLLDMDAETLSIGATTGGTVTVTGAAGETSSTQFASAVVDFSVSGTASGLIPAGALPVSVVTRVLTTISGGGATGYEIGDGSDVDRWGSISALTAGTTSDPEDFTDNSLGFNNSASAADVVLTGIGGTPTAGTVRVTVSYMSFGAPTS